MNLTRLLNIDNIHVHLQAQTKEETIETVVNRLVEVDSLPDGERVLKAVLSREQAMSTGVGIGIAVPHATMPGLDHPHVAVATTEKGIDFDTMDGRPVHLIFLILSPQHLFELHLKLLSRVSRLCSDPGIREMLLAANDAETIYTILETTESKLPDQLP